MKRPLVSGLLATALAAAPLAAGAQEAASAAANERNEAVAPAAECFYPENRAQAEAAGPSIAEAIGYVLHYYDGTRARFRLAAALSAQEVMIGIRSDQKDVWRGYTDALLAMLPDGEKIASLQAAAQEDPKGPPAFMRAEQLADMLASYGSKAEALKKAISALRARLTPAQLDAARVPALARG